MKRRGVSTRAIHGRGIPPGPGEPVVQPIVTATTFAFDDAETFGRVMSEEEYGFLYSRLRNPTVEDLNRVLADLEAAEAAQSFASGMAAISAALMTSLLLALCDSKDGITISPHLRCQRSVQPERFV